MARNEICHKVFQAAFDFDERQIWKRLSNSDYFIVRVSGETSPMLGVVMGQGGEEFGLTLFRGRGALGCFLGMQDSFGPGDDIFNDMNILGFSMDVFGDMPPDAKALAKKAGFKPKPSDRMPQFIAMQPGHQPVLPCEAELKTFLQVLRGVVEADQKGLMNPTGSTSEDGVLSLRLTGDPSSPTLSVETERLEVQQEGPRVIPFPTGRPNLDGLPRLDATWLVGLPHMPAGIKGDDRSLQLLLVADDATELVLQAKPVFAGELSEAVDALVETFHGRGPGGLKGLPREILFSSRKLRDAVAPILQSAGVNCVYEPNIPNLQEIVADLFEHFGTGLEPFSEYVETTGTLPLPAPDDLKGWKEADMRLAKRFADHLRYEDRLWSSRAAKRYFGDDDMESFFKAHEARGVAQAYTAWGILDYRPTKKSKTEAENMLAKGLPDPEAILLRARMDACPTLYRIAAHDPKAGTVTLEDVLLDGMTTVHDRLFSENIDDGIFIAGRAFPAGDFHFQELAGPPLGAGMGMEAAEFLQDCGMEFTREGLRRDAHMFGRLWGWMDEWEANWRPPRLCNTDGDDLLLHTASFGLSDQQEVHRALLNRHDIEHDEENGEFIWLRDEKDGRNIMGGPVTLGRIEFIGDELVLSVNSAERFAKAREWLEKIPGVVFRGVTTRRLDEDPENRPLDERISKPEPVEMTPELVASVQDRMDRHYMDWLDTPLPVLEGKSPREVCRTANGRQKVAMLIRTMPDPMGQAPVRVPRQAMLRELGLKAEPTENQRADEALPLLSEKTNEASSAGKVGRNDPCPCGSGKKYKKCCGRDE